jgi:hypothetical protein
LDIFFYYFTFIKKIMEEIYGNLFSAPLREKLGQNAIVMIPRPQQRLLGYRFLLTSYSSFIFILFVSNPDTECTKEVCLACLKSFFYFIILCFCFLFCCIPGVSRIENYFWNKINEVFDIMSIAGDPRAKAIKQINPNWIVQYECPRVGFGI